MATNALFDALFKPHSGSDAVFIETRDGVEITYSAFLNLASRYANAFSAMGLVKGDRLAVQIGKSVDALAVYAACVRSGIIFLPLNIAYTAEEVSFFVSDSGAKLLLCDAAKLDSLRPVAGACGALIETLNEDGSGTISDMASAQSDQFETVNCAGNDLAAFLYTSGTTGRSKGAMLSHDNLLSNALTLVNHWKFTDKDVLLHALPIFHTHGLFVATNVILAAGARMIYLPKLDVNDLINLMPRATSLMGVPTFYTRLLADDRFDRALTQNMRLFISGSAPLLAETHIEFEARTGHKILERYGMTETNMNTSNPYDGDRRAGTVGLPLPGVELKITDPNTGATLPTGEIGLIEVRGPNVFQGYWNLPEKTREELREDGFFITGDLGVIDPDGYVTIVGRNKDLIISGGYNIYPKEIELILDEMPAVLESAVIGVPHPDFGETPVGILVAKSGQTPDLADIAQRMGKSLARFKQPQRLIVIDELPRNTMGKVQKNVLRDAYKDLFK